MELMGGLHTKADSGYHEYVRMLTEQFIYGLDDKVMKGEVLRELTALNILMRPPMTTYLSMPDSGGSEIAKKGEGHYTRNQRI